MARIEKRTLKDGATRYKVIIRRKGLPLKTKTFGSKSAADSWAKRQEVKILDNRAIPDWEAEKHSLSDAIDGYLEDWLPDLAASDQRNRRRQLEWWRERLGHSNLGAITLGEISDQRRELIRSKQISGATANRYVAAISGVLNYCVSDRHWLDRNPARGLQRKRERSRDRFLSLDERNSLLEACRDSSERRLYPLVVFALATGARQGELLNLKWKDVDLKNRRAVLHKTKNRDKRTLHFVDTAGDLLAKMSKTPNISGYLFAHPELGRPVFPQSAWYEAVGKSGLGNFRFHDLRHTAASYVAQSGSTLAELAAFLGHRSLASVKRYAHLTDQHQEGVAKRMAKKYLVDV